MEAGGRCGGGQGPDYTALTLRHLAFILGIKGREISLYGFKMESDVNLYIWKLTMSLVWTWTWGDRVGEGSGLEVIQEIDDDSLD